MISSFSDSLNQNILFFISLNYLCTISLPKVVLTNKFIGNLVLFYGRNGVFTFLISS